MTEGHDCFKNSLDVDTTTSNFLSADIAFEKDGRDICILQNFYNNLHSPEELQAPSVEEDYVMWSKASEQLLN